MLPRSLYYAALSMVSSLGKGEDYNKIPHIIMINLLDYIEQHDGGDDEWLSSFTVSNKHTNKRMPNAFDIYNLELPRFRNAYASGQIKRKKLYKWFILLSKADDTLIEKWAKDDSELEDYETMLDAFANSAELLQYLIKEKEIKDAKASFNNAKELGIEIGTAKGIEIGKSEGKAEIIINMLKDGMAIAKIAALAHVSEDEVQKLQTSLKPEA